jgi:uncharacterized membrane protein YphA (DoxX/SURF4 family)
MKARIKEIVDNRWLIFTLRLVLGGIFIAASVGKIPHQAEFINTVTSYGILPDNLAHAYGLILPWAELSIGCCLVLGIFSRLASALSIPLILSFIIASAYALFHTVEDSCGCFGQLIPISHSTSLVIDAVMLIMAVPLVLHKAEFLSIGTLLSRLKLGSGRRRRFVFEKGSKFAVVALAVLAIGMPLLYSAPTSQPPAPPIISYSSSSFSFAATEGGSNPLSQTLELWNSGDGALNWSVSEDATWLSLDPISGSSTGEHGFVTVSVNISGMAAGDYDAAITISAPGATNTPQTVPVSLTVSSPTPEPAITYSPSGFSFTATKGGSNPSSQTLEIWNSGNGTLNWSVSEDATWLSLDPISGSSTGEHDAVTVSVNISGMDAGDYNATITITAEGATNTPQTVPVSLTVNQRPNQPSNILPAAGATGVSLTPTLSSSDFSDPDPGDTHAASRWQVATGCTCNPTIVFDTERDTVNLITITIPPEEELEPGKTYHWRVQYQDNHGAWSEWSDWTSFTTGTGS